MNLVRQIGATVRPFVLVTLVAAPESAPRTPGAHLIVTADATHGTIGGGAVELHATEKARGMLGTALAPSPAATGSEPEWEEWSEPSAQAGEGTGRVFTLLYQPVHATGDPWVALTEQDPDAESHALVLITERLTPGRRDRTAFRTFVAGETLVHVSTATGAGKAEDALAHARSLLASRGSPAGMHTTGSGERRRSFFFDVLVPTDFRIAVFGAGHVGRALTAVLSVIDCDVSWIDDRAGIFPAERTSDPTRRIAADPADTAARIEPGTWCVVMTHSHSLDREICARLLARDDLPFVGLLGSTTKRDRFGEQWRRDGLTDDQIGRLVCPVGIATIKESTPGAIAIATAAQLLELRLRRQTSGHSGR